MAVTELVERNRIRIAGLLGILGMGLGVLADLASGYSLRGTADVTTAFSVLSIDVLSAFLVSKPPGEVILGHYLAIIGIPLGLFGLWQVYWAIRPAGRGLSLGVWFLGVFAFVAGTVFHSTFAFITFGIQAVDRAPPAGNRALQTMLERFAMVFEPLGLLLVGVMVVAFALIFVAVGFRETRYPRWFALANPLLIQVVTGAIALAAPLDVRIFLIVTSYNLSVLVFFALSTALLWYDAGLRTHTSRAVRW